MILIQCYYLISNCRCFPYLQRALEEPGCNLSKAKVAKLICQKQPVKVSVLISKFLDCYCFNIDVTIGLDFVRGLSFFPDILTSKVRDFLRK